ncbi:MAG: glycerophosphodiester phosphodiesterase, partial [Acholeplasmataceae bacterium]|nr:glycerophosphodiester phosphodiesterase [Acholeplasmataceae bacterium]
ETNDRITAKRFIEKMDSLKIYEFFLISEDENLLVEVKNKNGFSNCILKLNHLNHNKTIFNRVFIPIDLIDKETVKSFLKRAYTVYTEANTLIERKKAILAGVHGIITSEPVDLLKCYNEFLKDTQVRDVFFIAHRGLHNGYKESISPENSLETALYVANSGAEIIEIDVHLTLDDEVVVIHDFKTNRVSKDKRVVSKTTLNRLEEVKLKKTNVQKGLSQIKSLKDFLTPFKDKDVNFFIEIKPISRKLVINTIKVLEELNMKERAVFISFGFKNIVWKKTYLTTINNGYLYSKDFSSNGTFLDLLIFLISLDSTFNPQYQNIKEDIVRKLNNYGITVWPWTVDGIKDIYRVYTMGVMGITTNNFDSVKDEFLYLSINENYDYIIGSELEIFVNNYSLSGKNTQRRGNLMLVSDGDTGIRYHKNKIIEAKNEGVAYFYFNVPIKLPNGEKINKTTELFKVNVKLK